MSRGETAFIAGVLVALAIVGTAPAVAQGANPGPERLQDSIDPRKAVLPNPCGIDRFAPQTRMRCAWDSVEPTRDQRIAASYLTQALRLTGREDVLVGLGATRFAYMFRDQPTSDSVIVGFRRTLDDVRRLSAPAPAQEEASLAGAAKAAGRAALDAAVRTRAPSAAGSAAASGVALYLFDTALSGESDTALLERQNLLRGYRQMGLSNAQEMVARIVAKAASDPEYRQGIAAALESQGVPFDLDPRELSRRLAEANIEVRTLEATESGEELAQEVARQGTELVKEGVAAIAKAPPGGDRTQIQPPAPAPDWWKENETTREAAREALVGTALLTQALLQKDNPKLAADIGKVVDVSVAIHDTIDKFKPFVDDSSNLVATLGWVGLTTNIAGLALQLFSAANSGPSPDELILEQLQLIREQIAELKDIVIKQGERLELRLDEIAARMDRNSRYCSKGRAISSAGCKRSMATSRPSIAACRGLSLKSRLGWLR